MNSSCQLKVVFNLEPDAWHGYGTESLWVELVGENRYRLKNSPFYAKGVSFEDEVFANPNIDGQLVFSSIALRAGHSTYRIFLKQPIEGTAFRDRWAPLQKLGCSFEGHGKSFLAIDVPMFVDIHQVYDLLQLGEDTGVWEFEEGHCGHPVKEGGSTGGTT